MYLSQINNFLSIDIDYSQNGIDNATQKLTNLLLSGALEADQAPKLNLNRKVDKKAGSRRDQPNMLHILSGMIFLVQMPTGRLKIQLDY